MRFLRELGFSGAYSGGKHQFMLKDDYRLHIPNPHINDIGKNLLSKIISEADIDKSEWGKL